jgi:hypothetical protein
MQLQNTGQRANLFLGDTTFFISLGNLHLSDINQHAFSLLPAAPVREAAKIPATIKNTYV